VPASSPSSTIAGGDAVRPVGSGIDRIFGFGAVRRRRVSRRSGAVSRFLQISAAILQVFCMVIA
jgi:hypothetical protein